MVVGPYYRRSKAEISLRTTYKHMRGASSAFRSKRMFVQSERVGERREGRRHAERERVGERWDTVGYDDRGRKGGGMR